MTPQPKRLAKREGSFSAFLARFRCTLNICGKYYWQAKRGECPVGKCKKCQILWSKCKDKKLECNLLMLNNFSPFAHWDKY